MKILPGFLGWGQICRGNFHAEWGTRMHDFGLPAVLVDVTPVLNFAPCVQGKSRSSTRLVGLLCGGGPAYRLAPGQNLCADTGIVVFRPQEWKYSPTRAARPVSHPKKAPNGTKHGGLHSIEMKSSSDLVLLFPRTAN